MVQKKDYSNLNEIESELEEIQKKTKSTDPNSAFAILLIISASIGTISAKISS